MAQESEQVRASSSLFTDLPGGNGKARVNGAGEKATGESDKRENSRKAAVDALTAPLAAAQILTEPGPECYMAGWIYERVPVFKQIQADAVALGLNPDAVLLTELARIGVLMGPADVPGPRLTTLGIMVPLVGNSGDGKGTIQDLAWRHLPTSRASDPERFRQIGLGTGQGLAKAFYSEVAAEDGHGGGWERTIDALWVVGSESGGISAIAKQNNGENIMAMEALWSREDPARQNAGKDYNFPVKPGTFVSGSSFAIQIIRATALINADTTGGGFAHRLEWAVVFRPNRPFPVVRDVSQIPPLDWTVPDGDGLELSSEVELALAREVWERGQVFRAGDDMDGHRGARLAKLTLLVAVSHGSRRGETPDLEIAREILRCSGAIRDWLVSGMEAHQAAEDAKRGRADATRRMAYETAILDSERLRGRLMARLVDHGSVVGSSETEVHVAHGAGVPGLCSSTCLNQIFDGTARAAGREVLAALVGNGLVEERPVEGRRTPFYFATQRGVGTLSQV